MIPILYEDNHILVAVKPPNMPSQEDASGDPDMLTVLKQDVKERYQKPGNVYLGLVHRLDRPVGGVMIFARTSKAASRLSDDVRTRRIDKQYLAVVTGKPSLRSDKVVDYLVKDSRSNMVSVTDEHDPHGKRAVLTYEHLYTIGDLSLLRIRLETGRPHQIRVQLANLGHPIIGDQRYGRHQDPGQQIALWSFRLTFMHPVKKERMSFTSLPPEAMPWNLFQIQKTIVNI